MCQICATFNPFLNGCQFEGLTPAPEGAEIGIGAMTPLALTVNEGGDAGATTSTSASMNVGDVFMGVLNTASDSDWVAVNLVAGQQYTVAIAGTGALGTSNDDPYLRIRDASGTQIESDDDDGPGRYSNLTFTASYTGTYYLDAQSWNNSDAGTYGMSIVEGARAYYNAEMGAGALMRPDESWSTSPGTGATISWGVRASGIEPDGGNPFIPLSNAQAAAAQDVMSYLDALSGLNLNQINPGGTTNNATILIGAYSANDGSGAYAYYPGSIGGNTAFGSNAGDVWMNNNAGSTTSLPLGSYSYFVFLHEIGHAIGLAHPGEYNAAPGVSITYSNNAQFIQDSQQYTVMSYFDEANTGVSSGLGYPDTFMLYDLLAIHQLYGANTSYNSGNTVYGFNASAAGSAYDFNTNSTPFLSIYDGSGADTIDLSGYNMAQNLNLNQGTFSNIGGYTGNMSVAFGAVIENAVGGSGNDTIEGNAADNQITGGNGTDTFVIALNRADVTVTQIAGGYQVSSSLGVDTLYGVEFILFNDQTLDLSTFTSNTGPTTGNDNLTGTAAGDTIDLLAGDDSYVGGNGNDSIFGNAGDDTLEGGAGADTLDGGADNDTATYANATSSVGVRLDGGLSWGGASGDVLVSIENLVGGVFGDTFVGSDIGNVLDGGGGSDTIYGLGGNDTILGGLGNDLLYGQSGNNLIQAGSGDDTVYGGSGMDTVEGGDNDDLLVGLAGNDSLFGGAGSDTLIGGDGADTLNGGAGSDWIDYTGAVNSAGTRFDGVPGWSIAAGDVMIDIENAIGTVHNDIFVGSDVGNHFITGDGNDKVFALDGADTLEGGTGNDTLYGQAGDDLLIGGTGSDQLWGGLGNDTVSYATETSGVGMRLDGLPGWGAATGDTLHEIENLIGTSYNDIFVGSWRDNRLEGGAGDDKIYALEGDDTLIGGAGDDTLYGQNGSDVFVFNDGFGNDVIADFNANDSNEKIDLSSLSTIANYGELTSGNRMTQLGNDVVIDDLNGNTITVLNTTLAAMSSDDFIF